METQEFLEWLLPPDGNVVVSYINNGEWVNRPYTTAEEAAGKIKIFDVDRETYFAVNRFNDPYYNEKGKKQLRTKVNCAWSKALYDDYDVDPDIAKKYDSKKEALGDVVKLAQALELTPTVVDSGGGYHAYYPFKEAVDPKTWLELASLKRKITTFLDMKVDSLVDIDLARVLRPVGTFNKKYDPPRPVKLLKKGEQYDVDFLRERMEEFIQRNGVDVKPQAGGFGHTAEYGPALDREKTRLEALNSGEWHSNTLKLVGSYVAKGLSDEEIYELVSDLTAGEPKSGPPRIEQVQNMINGAREKGWCPPEIDPTVASKNPNVAASDDDAATTTPTQYEGQSIPYWHKDYVWNGVALSKRVPDADGVVQPRAFSRSFVYPINRIRNSEGTWVVHWRAREKNGNWREFFMDTSELASPNQMAETFAAHEVFLMRTRTARSDMAEFAETLIETLQKYKIETKTYGQFGWTEDRKGFVMGTKMITAKGSHDVLCDDNIPPDVAVDFGRSGTLEEWIANIKTLYNRKSAEPFQFALCHSMGSILVELMGSSNWHGLPLAFTGEGATGKTTACKIACGFYGNQQYMMRQTAEQGTTLNAVIKRIASTGAVPFLLDEFSGRTPEELTRTGYALANGRDKERLKNSGGYATVGKEWFKNSFITSNDSILESISKLPAGYKVEATQLRFFEVSMPEGYKTTVFPDVTTTFVEHHMDHVYGEACLPYIRFVIKNMDWVRKQIVAARNKFNPQSDEDNKERFYRDTIVTALVAGKIAEKLGLVSFDIDAMTKWAEQQVKLMRDSRRDVNVDIKEHLATFIGTLHGRLIVTRKMHNNSANKEDPQVLLKSAAVGRVCTEDKKAFVTIKAVTDWCKDNNVAPSAIRDELDRAGYLVYQADGSVNPRMYIGKGSNVPTGQARCYELKYHKLMDGSGLTEVSEPEVKNAATS